MSRIYQMFSISFTAEVVKKEEVDTTKLLDEKETLEFVEGN